MKVVLLGPASPDRMRLREWLAAHASEIDVVETAAAAIRSAGCHRPAVVFADLAFREEAVALLRSLLSQQRRSVWVIAIVDRRQPAAASEALRLGAVDLVMRPLSESDVLAALDNAREYAGLIERPANEAEPAADCPYSESPRMRQVYEAARRIAPRRCPVLIVGEPGTGRETIARTIHERGPDASEAFVLIPAAAGAARLESVLDGPGTVYIEDVHLMGREAQRKLEQWLADRQSASGERPAGRRVIAGAEPVIDALAARRAFRPSLLESVSVVRLDLPTLRDRPQDIPLIAASFLKQACRRHNAMPKTFSRAALALLAALPWRGNVAELHALAERLALLVPHGVVLQEDVLQHVRLDLAHVCGGVGGTLRDARRHFEREFIVSTLQRHRWRMEETALELGIERTNLYRKIKQLSIVRDDHSA